jgi:transposase, IS30 family
MSRRHLTIEDREVIAAMAADGSTQEEMAEAVGKSQSAISRELRRNRQASEPYRPVQAHRRAVRRRCLAFQRRERKMQCPELLRYVKAGLRQCWSPEQIAGRLEWERGRRTISHETIYQWIWRSKREGQAWHRFLRQAHRKHRRRSRGTLDKRGKIPDRVFIDQRPAEVQAKRRFGHWEGDTLVGKNSRGAVVTHVERKSQYLVMAALPVRDHRKLVHVSRTAFARHERSLRLPRRTETLDNGQEFWSHKQLGQTLGLSVYFARPHHPWERGLNEQVNGLIRQFLPKGSPLENLRLARVRRIETLLNNRPRKTLRYRTPTEVLRTRRVLYAFQT